MINCHEELCQFYKLYYQLYTIISYDCNVMIDNDNMYYVKVMILFQNFDLHHAYRLYTARRSVGVPPDCPYIC